MYEQPQCVIWIAKTCRLCTPTHTSFSILFRALVHCGLGGPDPPQAPWTAPGSKVGRVRCQQTRVFLCACNWFRPKHASTHVCLFHYIMCSGCTCMKSLLLNCQLHSVCCIVHEHVLCGAAHCFAVLRCCIVLCLLSHMVDSGIWLWSQSVAKALSKKTNVSGGMLRYLKRFPTSEQNKHPIL